MNLAHKVRLIFVVAITGTLVLPFATILSAQQTATNNTNTTAVQPPKAEEGTSDKDVLVLSPFVVDSSGDADSYMVNSTLAGTRVRTDVKNIPSALTIVTSKFLEDTAATNNQSLLLYTPNTQVAGIRGNFSGSAGAGNTSYTENLRTPQTATRVRGLAAADNTRSYFLTDIPWDSFNTGRIDIQRGPNSVLFGVGSPAGIINADINDAEFKNANKVQNRVDEYGSVRTSVDFNRVLLRGQLAFRIAGVDDHEGYQQDYTYNNSARFYGAVRYEPNLFGEDAHTSLRVKYENGKVRSNNPRALPPTDLITPWFAAGKPLVNQFTVGQSIDSTAISTNPLFNVPAGTRFAGAFVNDIITLFNANSSAPIYAGTSRINGNPSAGGGNGAVIHGRPQYEPLAVANYTQYAVAAGIPGGAFYSDKVITDPSVFDFYDSILDGPNGHQWQNWDAFNVALSQTFFKNRLGFEVIYDKQSYDDGQAAFWGGSGGSNYSIGVDVNSTFATGAINPNAGRPYVALYQAFDFGNASSKIDRDSVRGALTADLRAEDIFQKNSLLERIFGHHVLTGFAQRDTRKQYNLQWQQYATTLAWPQTIGAGLNSSLNQFRGFDAVAYIGPAFTGTSATGANLTPVSVTLRPPPTQVVKNFNATYIGTANKNDPYTYTSPATGLPVVGTQADNPANYVGFQDTTISWLDASNSADFPELVTNSSKTNFRDTSQGLVYQGYFLNDSLVPVFSWRRDKVFNNSTSAPKGSTTPFVATQFDYNPAQNLDATGETRAWGAVYHLPLSLTRKLPGNTGLSVFYNKNENFIAQAPRISLSGTQLPNPTGSTKEFGVIINTLNDKLVFKFTRYRTVVENSTLANSNNAGLGTNGYFIWAMPSWWYYHAAYLQEGLNGNTAVASNLYDGGGVVSLAARQDIVKAWLNTPISDATFAAYSIRPTPIVPSKAKASGRIYDGIVGGFNLSDSFAWASLSPTNFGPVSTVDLLSQGSEFELTARPTKNWNVTVNYSRTFASRNNIDSLTQAYIQTVEDWLKNTAAGQLPIAGTWGSTAGTGLTFWETYVYKPYQVLLANQGRSAPDVAPWVLNGVTTYQFDHGRLRGAFVGGAARLEAGRILGYKYNPTLDLLDVTQPLYGPNDKHFDLWFGYNMKLLSNKVNWRIQVNLQNVGENKKLVPAQYEPDGSLALMRIQQGMSWQLTNTFEF